MCVHIKSQWLLFYFLNILFCFVLAYLVSFKLTKEITLWGTKYWLCWLLHLSSSSGIPISCFDGLQNRSSTALHSKRDIKILASQRVQQLSYQRILAIVWLQGKHWGRCQAHLDFIELLLNFWLLESNNLLKLEWYPFVKLPSIYLAIPRG